MASVNRGCLAISAGGENGGSGGGAGGGGGGGGRGGARTEVLDDGVTRAPCIAMPDIRQASELRRVRLVRACGLEGCGWWAVLCCAVPFFCLSFPARLCFTPQPILPLHDMTRHELINGIVCM